MIGPARSRAFSLLELLVTIAIIAVLVSLLLPLLLGARRAGWRAVCASNLRQMNIGWQGYVQDNKEQLPRHAITPEWNYGGVDFVGAERRPILASDRPINRYLSDGAAATDAQLIELFRCPADAGVFPRGRMVRGQAPLSILPQGSCFETFGTSYKANPYLLDSAAAGLGGRPRALAVYEIQVDLSRLLLTGDTAWWYALHPEPEASLEASWHQQADAGNMLAMDGSIRFLTFGRDDKGITLRARPQGDE